MRQASPKRGRPHNPPVAPIVVHETAAPPSREELVGAALEVGLRLEALAFHRGDAAFWFVQKFQDGPNPCAMAPAGLDLYLGQSGIALFLALTRGEMPGLMLGLAGIGYGLLRAGAPERVPSVLRLAPPIS